jgi:hypothetical protein
MQFTTTEWFPNDAKTMAAGGCVQNFNWSYILLKYGTFEGHDFYFTNKEAFDNAKTIAGMLIANPKLFFEIVIGNLKALIPAIMTGIWIPKSGAKFVDRLFNLILFIIIIYGAFCAARDRATKTLIIGTLFTMISMPVLASPKSRYMFPMIPVFIMAASWYGAILATFLKKLYPSAEKLLQKMAIAIFAVGILSLLFYSIMDSTNNPLKVTVFLAGTILALFCAGMLFAVARFAKASLRIEMSRFILAIPTVLLLVIFSTGNVLAWAGIMHNVVDDVGRSRLSILKGRETSLKAALLTLAPIVQSCRGIMSLEHNFFGAFLGIPQTRVYDVWEIPPFGHLHNSPYKGLNPDRIDCVLVSTELATGVGAATNYQIRYQNYIKPYIDQLISCGAVKYEIPFYGHAIVLQKQLN